jgi:hypothetical protein
MRRLVERVHVENLRAGRQGQPFVAHTRNSLRKNLKVLLQLN